MACSALGILEADQGRRRLPDEKGIETMTRSRHQPGQFWRGGTASPMRRGLKRSFCCTCVSSLLFGGAASPMRRGLKQRFRHRRCCYLFLGGAASPMRRGLKLL